ncbi:hypothetical protein JCM6882_002574 [Rhodosporidiobolus microsporus]
MSSLGKRSSPSSSAPEAPPSSSQPLSTPAAKRVKPAPSSSSSAASLMHLLALDAIDLSLLPHEELVAHVQALQGAYRASQAALGEEKKKKAPLAAIQPQANDGPEGWDEDKVKQKARQVADVAHKAIKSSMKWQPSCKTSSTKWSYTGVVPSLAVFYALFHLPVPTKKKDLFKVKKLSHEQFDAAIGEPWASDQDFHALGKKEAGEVCAAEEGAEG